MVQMMVSITAVGRAARTRSFSSQYPALMISIFASPGDDYLRLVGELAYAVTSLEATLIFDIGRLSTVLPATFTVETLEGKTAGGIGHAFINVAPKVTDPDVSNYCVVGGQSLVAVAAVRNDVLHARPVTIADGEQRLSRKRADGARFTVDNSWLEQALAEIATHMHTTNAVRPSHVLYPSIG